MELEVLGIVKKEYLDLKIVLEVDLLIINILFIKIKI